MSERQPARRRIQVNLQRLRGTRYGGMFGPAELIALGGSLLVLFVAVISYVYFLVPARSNLETSRQEQTRLRALLASQRKVVQEGQTTEAAANSILASLDEFEGRGLNERTAGRMQLYDELNQLIRKNGLRNTSGPTYTQLDPTGSKTAAKGTNTKWQSVYPGIGVSVTVEGPYQNLRRFIRDLEGSNVFVIVNGVELERAETAGGAAEAGGNRSSLVSLRLDMSTYFQRAPASDSSVGN